MVEEGALRPSRNHLALDGAHAVRVVATRAGHRAEPVTASGDDWVRSTPGDGAGLAVLHRLRNRMAVEDGFRVTTSSWTAPDDDSERPMGVDQTNESWVVGGTLVVKWMTDELDGPHPGPDRLRRLAEAGFTEMPALVGLVEWLNPGGDWAPLAVVQEFLPGAEDGWTWAVAECRRAVGLEPGEPTRFGIELGALTARMHLALAPDDPELISRELADELCEDALAVLAEAVRVTSVSDPSCHALLVRHQEDLEHELGELVTVAGHAGFPIHGDFHVGQVLRTPDGGLRVIDFDGNPTRPARLRMAPDVMERDLACMWQSLENVGHVVRHHAPEVDEAAVTAWVRQAQGDFMAEWLRAAGARFGHDDPVQVVVYLEQMCREFVYAARHLPSWAYVPAALLRGVYR